MWISWKTKPITCTGFHQSFLLFHSLYVCIFLIKTGDSNGRRRESHPDHSVWPVLSARCSLTSGRENYHHQISGTSSCSKLLSLMVRPQEYKNTVCQVFCFSIVRGDMQVITSQARLGIIDLRKQIGQEQRFALGIMAIACPMCNTLACLKITTHL